MPSGIRRVNDRMFTLDGQNMAGHLDSLELARASEIFIEASKVGLTPLRLKQGFRGHDPTLTCAEGTYFCSKYRGSWTFYNQASWADYEFDGNEDFDIELDEAA